MDELDVTVTPADGGYEVLILAGAAAPDMESLFLRLGYDASRYQAHCLIVDASASAEVIGLAVEPEPGQIDIGVVATALAAEPAVAAGDLVFSCRLQQEPGRVSSSVASGGRARARNLELAQADGGNWRLSWDYTNPGDTNQDGEVGIQDLTPIGLHYLQNVSNSWDDPLRHVDGDLNGEINMADITPVGQNYRSEIWAYQIEMSEDGETGFITVGQLLLGEQQCEPGVAVRFSYDFGAQYVSGAWYRVVPLSQGLEFGVPSEAISEFGRRIDTIMVDSGATVTITVYAHDLAIPIAQMNSVRVVFPESFEYVPNSANPGSPGGTTGDVDGLWTSFATMLLFPPDSFFLTVPLGQGKQAIDFNVTTIEKLLPAAPVGYGDLFSFKLKKVGSEDLFLGFVEASDDGLDRTYYTDGAGGTHYFGNNIGLRVQ